MKTKQNLLAHIDWLLLLLYASLVIFGWCNIYAVGYEKTLDQSLFDFSSSSGKQFTWIVITVLACFVTFFFDIRSYQSLAYVIYIFGILLLLSPLFMGAGTGGHKAWLWLGGQGQPSEFAKLACALAMAKYLDENNMPLARLKPQLVLWTIILVPVAIILLQGDVGSGLVFSAFVIVLYREGLPAWFIVLGLFMVILSVLILLVPHLYLIIGTVSLALVLIGLARKSLKRIILIILLTLSTLALIEGFHLVFEKVLKPHQQNRIKALVDPNIDPLGIGWNVTQSKIAIGSGGLWGKGYLQGTQTKYGFVPEQRTDFIFCTIGEEHGWIGSLLVIVAFLGLILRILYLAERQKLRFARVYGYSVAAVFFFHFMINIGMTIGLMPVIGIPLPFISYGGSSMLSFSLMLSILLKLDSERKEHRSWQQISH